MRWLVAVAVLVARAGAKARKASAPGGEEEGCRVCWDVAVHARRAMGFRLRSGAPAANLAHWKRVLADGCPARARRACGHFVDARGEDLAWALDDLYEEAEGDAALVDLGEVANALCGPDAPGASCPVEANALRPDEAALSLAPSARGVEVAVRNYGDGDIEIHVVDMNDRVDCSASEEDLLRTGESPAVRFAAEGAEARLFLSFNGPDGERVGRPTLRVKARGAPCGAGTDVAVDFDSPYALFGAEEDAGTAADGKLRVSTIYHENPEL